MEVLYILGIYVGFYIALATVVWLLRKISRFLETRRYKLKLDKLAPQIKSISIDELSSELSIIKRSCLSSTKLLRRKYKIREKVEQVKTIDKYVQEEAAYRRSKRRPARRNYQRKRRRYY